MKEVTLSHGIRERPGLQERIQQATQLLEEVLGADAGAVRGEWDQGEDARGRTLLILRLSDFTGSVAAAFEPDELESPNHLSSRFNRLWADLLRIRSHRQLQEILQGSAEEGG